jgi:hypothetical protein
LYSSANETQGKIPAYKYVCKINIVPVHKKNNSKAKTILREN